nr:hypothetical protein GCM10020092_063340 [Actinoplanes digitatis]
MLSPVLLQRLVQVGTVLLGLLDDLRLGVDAVRRQVRREVAVGELDTLADGVEAFLARHVDRAHLVQAGAQARHPGHREDADHHGAQGDRAHREHDLGGQPAVGEPGPDEPGGIAARQPGAVGVVGLHRCVSLVFQLVGGLPGECVIPVSRAGGVRTRADPPHAHRQLSDRE